MCYPATIQAPHSTFARILLFPFWFYGTIAQQFWTAYHAR